jgi:hypothetical protein
VLALSANSDRSRLSASLIVNGNESAPVALNVASWNASGELPEVVDLTDTTLELQSTSMGLVRRASISVPAVWRQQLANAKMNLRLQVGVGFQTFRPSWSIKPSQKSATTAAKASGFSR